MKQYPFLAMILAASSSLGQGWTGDVDTITSAATTISFQQGLGSLAVQAASVTSPTPIFFGPSPLAPQVPTLVPGTVFAIGRPILQLSKPATLTLNYSTRSLPLGTSESGLRIYSLVNHKWTLVGGTVNLVNNTVSASITRAGTFALLAAPSSDLNAENLLVQAFANGTGTQNTQPPLLDWFSVSTGNLDTAEALATPIGRSIERSFPSVVSPAYNALFSVRLEPSGTSALYSSNADGSHPMRLTSIASQYITNIAVRGDGRTLCFTAYVGGAFNVYRMNANGSGISALATGLTGTLPRGIPLAVNPAGTQVTMVTGNTNLRVVNLATGGTVRTVSANVGTNFIHALAYNALGTTLAFTTDAALCTVVANAGAVQTRDSAAGFGNAVCWSPDGTRIAARYNNQVDVLLLSPKTWYDGAFAGGFGNAATFDLAWR